jgi:iron complex transport system substrate-binding protein
MGMSFSRRRRFASPAVTVILAALAACAALTGCGGSSSGGSGASGSGSSGNGTRVITDMTGRKVTIPAHVTRIASDYPAMAQVVYMLGAGRELVGVNQETAPAGSMFATVDPAMAKVPTPFSADTTHVNIESLIAAGTQLVLIAPGQTAMMATLAHAGIPAVVIAAFTGPSNLGRASRWSGTSSAVPRRPRRRPTPASTTASWPRPLPPPAPSRRASGPRSTTTRAARR